MENPARIPDPTEFYELLREIDRLAQVARIKVDAEVQLAESYTKQGHIEEANRHTLLSSFHQGHATAYMNTSRKLARLFGIHRESTVKDE